MAAAPHVKPEPGIKAEPEEVGGPSPAALSDDDIYEDAGDLEFYDTNLQPNHNADSVYLTHVPKYLYDAWASLDDDTNIKIGTIRQWTETDKKGQQVQKIALLLNHEMSEHQPIPKEYNLDIRDMSLTNTFLFTEQDLPGYKSKSQGANSNIPPHLRPKPERTQENKPQEGGRRARYQPRYRKAIPKKTTLAGRFRHELNCYPVDTPETRYIMRMRNDDAMKPRATTTLTSKRTGNIIQAGAHRANESLNSFMRTAPEPKKAKKQKEEKAARLPQSELRDRIFQCYDKFNYWSMKAFKQSLNQPEAWLRENLDDLAVLHKTGRFANHWELKAEYKRANLQSVEEAAPDVAPEGEDSDSAGEDVEMEDVV